MPDLSCILGLSNVKTLSLGLRL